MRFKVKFHSLPPEANSHRLVSSKSGQCETIPTQLQLIQPKFHLDSWASSGWTTSGQTPQAITHRKRSLQVWSRASSFLPALQQRVAGPAVKPASFVLQKPPKSCSSLNFSYFYFCIGCRNRENSSILRHADKHKCLDKERTKEARLAAGGGRFASHDRISHSFLQR